MQYFQASDELLLHVAPANRGTRNVQPFLVCSKKGQERKGIYYIMADGHLIKIGDNGRVQQTHERSLLLDDLEEYTNSSERSRIRSATVESAERDQCYYSIRHSTKIALLFLCRICFRFDKLLRLFNELHNEMSKTKRMQHCTRYNVTECNVKRK